jgi:hypothetical protein
MDFAIDAYLCSLTRRHINRWDLRIHADSLAGVAAHM